MASVIRGDDNFDSAEGGPNATFGGVGTYAFLQWEGASQQSPGATVAGSSLYPASSWGGTSGAYYSGVGRPSGTWRLMGSTGYYGGTVALDRSDTYSSVFVRIS